MFTSPRQAQDWQPKSERHVSKEEPTQSDGKVGNYVGTLAGRTKTLVMGFQWIPDSLE